MDANVKDGTATAICGDTLVGLWLVPVSQSAWKWHVQQLQQIARRHREGALYLDLISPSSSPPDAAVRAAM